MEYKPRTGSKKTDIKKSEVDRAEKLAKEGYKNTKENFKENWNEWNFDESIKYLRKAHAWRVAASILRQFPSRPIYLIDSIFLKKVKQKLFEDPETESMVYATGAYLADRRIRTLSRTVEFEMERQTAAGVKGDMLSSSDALIELDENGHQLLAWIHNHPGKGRSSTRPSSTDLDHQRRLENSGYSAIGIIMTPDGYMRPFSKDIEFQTEVYGSGIERVEGDVYRFEP